MTRKILIIDDEPDIVTYLTTLLEDHNHTVISAYDAYTGLELAKKEMPDLICLDIMMPKRSGFSLYRDFKGDDMLKNIPIVIISALEGVAYGFEGLDFKKLIPGTDLPEPAAFFEKPVDVARFIAVIDSLFDSDDVK